MKCPNPKCKKKGELRTKRTIANGRTVQRERICPACGQRADTIEMFRADWDEDIRKRAKELQTLRGDLNEKADQLESLTHHFQQIFKICGVKK